MPINRHQTRVVTRHDGDIDWFVATCAACDWTYESERFRSRDHSTMQDELRRAEWQADSHRQQYDRGET